MSAILSITGLSKTFGENTVLDSFHLDLVPGEIHALLGHNGSGKSTFIKVLSGYHEPDPGGSLWMHGEKVAFSLGSQASAGLAFVHQELGLVEGMSVADNFAIGRYPMRGPAIDREALHALVESELADYRLNLSPGQVINHTVSPGQRAILALARAVRTITEFHETGVIVLDEPTVYLTDHETTMLQERVRTLAEKGNTVIYVTHRLKELVGFADAVTVLREGKIVHRGPMAGLDRDQLITYIVGSPQLGGRRRSTAAAAADRRALRISGVNSEILHGVSLEIAPGEIVGLAGLVGMGQDQILECIFGSEPAQFVMIEVGGTPHKGSRSPIESVRQRIGLLPSDRVRRSGALDFTIAENISLPVLSSYVRGGRVRRSDETRTAQRLVEEFGVLPTRTDIELRRLSGGNQQKVLLAKWMQYADKVLLLIEPVQGVDVGAKKTIFSKLQDAADAGTAILIASTEHEDLAEICDRVIVFRDGRITDEIVGDNINGERILRTFHE